MTKLAIVTGANKGIGFGIVEKLAEHLPSSEWRIYLTSRNAELGKEALEKMKAKSHNHVHYFQLDISKKESRQNMVDHIKQNYSNGLNIFVNNAGIAYKHDSTAPFAEQAEVTCDTNYFANVHMLLDLIPFLAQNARVVNVSSKVSHMALKKLNRQMYEKFTGPMKLAELDDLMKQFIASAKAGDHVAKGFADTAYGMSKVGLTKATYIISEDLKMTRPDVVLNACCPGYVSTDMTSQKGHKSIEEGADTPFYLATLAANEPNGEFVSERKVVPWNNGVEIRF